MALGKCVNRMNQAIWQCDIQAHGLLAQLRQIDVHDSPRPALVFLVDVKCFELGRGWWSFAIVYYILQIQQDGVLGVGYSFIKYVEIRPMIA